MAVGKAESRLCPLCLGMVVAGMLLLVVSVQWVSAGAAASGTESAPTLLEKRDMGRVQLPRNMNPMDVVRVVQRNRARMGGSRSVNELGLDSSSALHGGAHYERDYFGPVPVHGDDNYDAESFRSAPVHGALHLSVAEESPSVGHLAPAEEVEPAFHIGAESVNGPASNVQRHPAVAFDGTNYLVAWEEYDGGPSRDIYGARVSAGGSVLDPSGIAISTAADDQGYPQIVFDGTNYLVVWQDNRGGSYDIYGTRVSAGGNVLDPDGIAISTAANDQLFPEIAFDGTNCLIVWEDLRSGFPDIYGARVNSGGSVLDTGGIAISTVASYQWFPAIASDGTDYLVAWDDNRGGSSWDIYGTRVSAGGSVLDPDGIAISTAANIQGDLAIAFDETNYLVVWVDLRSGSSYDIYGARVNASGSVLDTAGIAISIAAGDQELPAIAFDGTNHLVVWQDGRSGSYDIYGTRVSAGGNVLDPDGIAISTAEGYQQSPAISFNGTNYLVVWQDNRSGSSWDIYCARVSVVGTVLDPGGITGLTFGLVSATVRQWYVLLSWQMAVEAVTSSFRIERSESLEGEFLTLDLPISMSSGLCFSCTDSSVQPGKTYWYKIVLVGLSSEEAYGPIEVHVEVVPTAYRSYQSYPNPFNPLCTIRYEIPKAGRVSLQVYDIVGKTVRVLVDGWREPGVYSEIWNGRSDDGTSLPSGIYFYRLEAGAFVATRKMVLLH